MQLDLSPPSPSRRDGGGEAEAPLSSFPTVEVAEGANPEAPLFHLREPPTTSSSGRGGGRRMRRRAASDPSMSYPASRRHSFRGDVTHAAAETFLLTRLALTLLRYLGVGYRWITKFLALSCYAVLLMPGFLQVGYYYFFSSQVRRSVVYGEKPRNRLDLYLPANSDGVKPVVAFVTGGAWIIGYKAWGALLGKRLSERGIIVGCIDYRNFPQGTISNMVEDVSQGISFICNNIASYGGDTNRIYLIGQSAGAHIASCALLNQAIKECGEGENASWSVSQIKAYFGISGGESSLCPVGVDDTRYPTSGQQISIQLDEELTVLGQSWAVYLMSSSSTFSLTYNILNLVDHFHRRGLYRSIFLSIMEGEQSLWRFSPEVVVQDSSVRHAVSLLPRVILFHGTSDYSIPSISSKTFADALRSNGARVDLVLYEGKTHTDLFLQDPLRGGRDELLEDIFAVIHADDAAAYDQNVVKPPARRLVPECMLTLARRISPF